MRGLRANPNRWDPRWSYSLGLRGRDLGIGPASRLSDAKNPSGDDDDDPDAEGDEKDQVEEGMAGIALGFDGDVSEPGGGEDEPGLVPGLFVSRETFLRSWPSTSTGRSPVRERPRLKNVSRETKDPLARIRSAGCGRRLDRGSAPGRVEESEGGEDCEPEGDVTDQNPWPPIGP